MNTHAIEIVEYSSGDVVRTLEYTSERLADRAERGVERNLNHEEFYTRVMPIKKTTKKKAVEKKAAKKRTVRA